LNRHAFILAWQRESATLFAMKRCPFVAFVALLILAFPIRNSVADSSQWDWLAGTQWYVPAPNLLAYLVSPTGFSSNVPVSDQTLWDITSSTNGVIVGTSVATFTLGGIESSSTSAMNGVVTDSG
jgi:hypothetical protein